MNEPQVISIEEFEKQYIPKGRGMSWQGAAIKAMQPGQAIKMSHSERPCNTATTKCSIQGSIVHFNKRFADRFYRTSHAPDGDILVACYSRERTDA